MWSGTITINDGKAEVTVYENESNGLKSWYGFGRTSIGNILFNFDTVMTEIGEIVIDKYNIENGEFEFIGSGKPKINI